MERTNTSTNGITVASGVSHLGGLIIGGRTGVRRVSRGVAQGSDGSVEGSHRGQTGQ